MKSFLILSDTHGRKRDLLSLKKYIDSYDLILFLGDGLKDIEFFSNKTGKNFAAVCGNCDFSSDYPETIITAVYGHKIMLTHGHCYGVKSGFDRLAEASASNGCDIVLYGHTHLKADFSFKGINFFNPGSFYDDLSFGSITFDDKGSFLFSHGGLE